MKTYLHFIGNRYYTKEAFAEEAKAEGVTRRITRKMMGVMRFGDRCMLAILDGKTPLVFGYFIIERISGLNTAAIKHLQDVFTTRVTAEGGHVVHRGCGTYIAGQSLHIDAEIGEVIKALEKIENIGNLMVGGTYFEHEEVRIKKMPYQRGYRLFAYEKFVLETHEAKQTWNGRGYPKVKGQFYAKPEDFDAGFESVSVSEVQEVMDYKRAEDVKKEQKAKLKLQASA